MVVGCAHVLDHCDVLSEDSLFQGGGKVFIWHFSGINSSSLPVLTKQVGILRDNGEADSTKTKHT